MKAIEDVDLSMWIPRNRPLALLAYVRGYRHCILQRSGVEVGRPPYEDDPIYDAWRAGYQQAMLDTMGVLFPSPVGTPAWMAQPRWYAEHDTCGQTVLGPLPAVQEAHRESVIGMMCPGCECPINGLTFYHK